MYIIIILTLTGISLKRKEVPVSLRKEIYKKSKNLYNKKRAYTAQITQLYNSKKDADQAAP